MRDSIDDRERAPAGADASDAGSSGAGGSGAGGSDAGSSGAGSSGAGGASAVPRDFARRLLRRLPRTQGGDRLFALVHFVYAHRRLPRRGSDLFNDYLFFLKTDGALADALSQVTTDKVYAKHFIDSVVGRRVTPETYAVYDSVDAIRRADLPERCILKPAHGHAQHTVVLGNAAAAITEADRAVLRRGFALDVYAEAREPNYRHLRKRIICEELIGVSDERLECKLFCYRGAARIVLVAYDDPATGLRMHNYYDRDWGRLDIMLNDRPLGAWRPMPEAFPEMRRLAERIAAHFEHIRVDTYLSGGRVYVGELTHCHNAAHARFPSVEKEREFSRLLFG